MDFDPLEPLIFPQAVEQKTPSAMFMREIEETSVPQGETAVWFLGQNSWILKADNGTLLAIDPYLTDFCASGRTGEKKPKSRLLPIFIEPEDLRVDLVLITHSHTDHADPFTLERLNIKESALFLAPFQAVKVLENAGIPSERILLMHPLECREVKGLKITGSFAEPTDFSDLNHMGYIVEFPGGKVYYNSGDTAKSELLKHVAAYKPHWMSICINGGYHNLSHWEAAEITAAIHPQIVIPCHFDMMPHNLQAPHMFRKSLWEKSKIIKYLRMDYYRAYFF